jgi:hypothetical protein
MAASSPSLDSTGRLTLNARLRLTFMKGGAPFVAPASAETARNSRDEA